jgi:hypothetical protein
MSLSPTDLLQRYARLVVECGWGGAAGIAGKPVHVQHGIEAYPLLLAIAEEAYRQGAIRVDYTTWSPRLDALHVRYATDASLTDVPAPGPTAGTIWSTYAARHCASRASMIRLRWPAVHPIA